MAISADKTTDLGNGDVGNKEGHLSFSGLNLGNLQAYADNDVTIIDEPTGQLMIVY